MHTQTIILCLCVFLTTFLASDAVDYVVNNTAANITGGARFEIEIGANFTLETLTSAAEFIWTTFHETAPEDRKNVTWVSLFIRGIDEIAYTINFGSQSGAEIHVGAKFIGKFNGDLRKEFAGIVYHETTHVWQWDGQGGTPTWLIEGIADFVRLRAGFVPGHWVKPGDGDRWDQGYDVTARFLEYCEGLRHGFVAELNKKMRMNYSVNYFEELLEKSVDQLWKDYKANSGHIRVYN